MERTAFAAPVKATSLEGAVAESRRQCDILWRGVNLSCELGGGGARDKTDEQKQVQEHKSN
jgi:hypothetical protein